MPKVVQPDVVQLAVRELQASMRLHEDAQYGAANAREAALIRQNAALEAVLSGLLGRITAIEANLAAFLAGARSGPQ